jgi:hypothetical protein
MITQFTYSSCQPYEICTITLIYSGERRDSHREFKGQSRGYTPVSSGTEVNPRQSRSRGCTALTSTARSILLEDFAVPMPSAPPHSPSTQLKTEAKSWVPSSHKPHLAACWDQGPHISQNVVPRHSTKQALNKRGCPVCHQDLFFPFESTWGWALAALSRVRSVICGHLAKSSPVHRYPDYNLFRQWSVHF